MIQVKTLFNNGSEMSLRYIDPGDIISFTQTNKSYNILTKLTYLDKKPETLYIMDNLHDITEKIKKEKKWFTSSSKIYFLKYRPNKFINCEHIKLMIYGNKNSNLAVLKSGKCVILSHNAQKDKYFQTKYIPYHTMLQTKGNKKYELFPF